MTDLETLRKETKSYLVALSPDLLKVVSAKSVRRYLEAKFETSLDSRKKEVGDMILDCFHSISNEPMHETQSSPVKPTKPEKPSKSEKLTPAKTAAGQSSSVGSVSSKSPKSSRAQSAASDDSEMSELDDAAPVRKRSGGGWGKPMKISNQLQEIVNDKETQQYLLEKDGIAISHERITHLGRPTAMKYVWGYIKAKGLQDPNDGRMIRCDDVFKQIVGGKSSVSSFGMNKDLGQHFTKDASYVAPPNPPGQSDRSAKRVKKEPKPSAKRGGGGWGKALPMAPALQAIVNAAYVGLMTFRD